MEKRMALRCGLAALALSGVIGAAGCGSGGSSSPLSPGNRIVGIVEAPADQVARAESPVMATIGRLFTLGSPAQAAARINRVPISNASVTLALAVDGTTVATTTTDGRGAFRLEGTSAGTTYMLVAVVQGPRGQMRLKYLLRVAGSGEVNVTVNEATTVGAEAGAQAAADGATEADAVEVAAGTAEDQETAEEQVPAEVPDLTDPADVQEKAYGHLLGKFQARPGQGHFPPGLLMATQAAARFLFELDPALRLSPAQTHALAQAVADNKTFTAAQIQAALDAAGVKANGVTLTDADVTAALDALKARNELKDALTNVTSDQVPVVVALLLAEQANNTSVSFHVATQAELNAYINALLGGVELPGPGAQVPMGTFLGHRPTDS